MINALAYCAIAQNAIKIFIALVFGTIYSIALAAVKAVGLHPHGRTYVV